VSPEAVRLLIDFAYTRAVHFTPENIEQLLPLADQYHVPGLMKLCCEYLQRHLSHENCIGIMRFAQGHQCVGLERSALRYTLKHFNQVYTSSNEYIQVPLPLLCSLLSSDQLNVSCEEYVFDAITRWIDFDLPQRSAHIKQLLSTVRLGLLPFAVFQAKVCLHPLVASSADCRPMILDTEHFLEELDRSEEPDFDMSLPFARPRLPHEILFVIGGWSGGRPIKMVESYDTRADRWVVCSTEDHCPRAYHGVVAIGCLIYVIGGFDATECFSSCRVFNTKTKEWSEIAPMNQKRSYVSVALLDGHIYAMGGFEGPPRTPGDSGNLPRLRSAERFNTQSNQWTKISAMREARSDASATTCQDQVYVCGGFNGSDCLHSAESYSSSTDQWTLIPPMGSRRSGVGVIAYNGAIYAVGGFDGVTRVSTAEKYCPTERTWSAIPEMYNVRSNFAIEVIDDMMFAIGGFNGETTVYNVECYDSQSNEWYNATDMNLYKSALGACVVKDLPETRDYVYKKLDTRSEGAQTTSGNARQVGVNAQTSTQESEYCKSQHDPKTACVGTSCVDTSCVSTSCVGTSTRPLDPHVPPLDLSSCLGAPMTTPPPGHHPALPDTPPLMPSLHLLSLSDVTQSDSANDSVVVMDPDNDSVSFQFDDASTPVRSPTFQTSFDHSSDVRER